MSRWKTHPEEWVAGLDAGAKVGHKHHIIPKFVLRRWADPAGRLQVFSRADSKYSTRAIADVAVKDFYTFVALDGSSNSTYEEFLSKVEADAAATIAWLLNPLRRTSTELTTEQRWSLDLFVGFQLVRGPRSRREIEQLADFYGKSVSEGRIPDNVLSGLEFVTHQNDHIQTMGERAETVADCLHSRPARLVRLDQALLWISDEPVVVEHNDTNEDHHPDCFLTKKQLRQRAARAKKAESTEYSHVLHFRPTRRLGVLNADAILIPLAPNTALAFGPPAPVLDLLVPDTRLVGDAAVAFAKTHNDQISSSAVDVIIGPPQDQDFNQRTMPPPTAILQVCGPKGVATAAINEIHPRIRPRRYTKDVPPPQE